jgi:hypothetical protein
VAHAGSVNIELHWKSSVIEHHAMTVQLDEEQAQRVVELVSAGRSLAAAVGVTLGEGDDNDDAQELLEDWVAGSEDATTHKCGGARHRLGQEADRVSEQPEELLDPTDPPGASRAEPGRREQGRRVVRARRAHGSNWFLLPRWQYALNSQHPGREDPGQEAGDPAHLPTDLRLTLGVEALTLARDSQRVIEHE